MMVVTYNQFFVFSCGISFRLTEQLQHFVCSQYCNQNKIVIKRDIPLKGVGKKQ